MNEKQNPLVGRPVSDSAVERDLHIISPRDLNGREDVFGGVIFSFLDDLGASIVLLHSRRMKIATPTGEIYFYSPLKVGDLIVMRASVNRVWYSSCEVGAKIFRVEYSHQNREKLIPIATCYLTYVSLELDENNKRKPLPPVIPKTKAQKRRHEEANFRRAIRLALRAGSQQERIQSLAAVLEATKKTL